MKSRLVSFRKTGGVLQGIRGPSPRSWVPEMRDAPVRLSDLIGQQIEVQLGVEVRESPSDPLLVARGAVLLHEGAEDLDIIHAGEPVLARRATATIGRP